MASRTVRASNGSLCVSGCASVCDGTLCGREWVSGFRFVQMADPQLGMFAQNESVDDELMLCRLAVQRINALCPRPRFVIACGDLTHAEPSLPQYQGQVDAFKTAMQELHIDIPLVCVCGNHDVGNSPDAFSIGEYRRNFGDDFFSFWTGGVRCIVLNSMLYSDPTNAQQHADLQARWLEEELQCGAIAQHTLVFQHIPWFLQTPDEEYQYFNIDLQVRMEMLDKLNDAGVRAIFAGHWHRNGGGTHKNMQLIVSGPVGMPLGEDASGIRIVDVTSDSISHEYVELCALRRPSKQISPPSPIRRTTTL